MFYNKIVTKQKKVKARWVVKLPQMSKILVDRGDEVKVNSVLAEVEMGVVEVVDMSFFFNNIKEDEAEELKKTFINREVGVGEILREKKGMFTKSIVSPQAGVIKDIDEFFNFEYWQKVEGKREVRSPVGARVVEVSNEKIVLEFEAVEFSGESITAGKLWCEGKIESVDKLGDLNYQMKDRIIKCSNLSSTLLLKAEVLGVGGIILVCQEEIEDWQTKLPIVKMEEDDWDRLEEMVNGNKKAARVMLNSKTGRVLVVVE